ncbi:MAG TPA: DegV family protein [Clostridiales bacterium]|nr:DegV family protein [Clostridiales bacterium]
MSDFMIFSDSSCDMPNELLIKHNIDLVPFYVTFDQNNYFKENIEISNEEFYEKLISTKIFPKTSLPSITDYIKKFEPHLKEGKGILCICLTHNFSGSYQSAVNAKNMLEEQYPDANIHIVDSIQSTGGQGMVLLQAAYMREAGLEIDEVVDKINILKNTSRIMFTVDDLEYLARGGRIGKAASLAGNMLQLKPLIQHKDGELIPYSNIRGRKKSLDKIVEMTKEYFQENNEKYEDYDFCLANTTAIEEILKVKEKLESLIGRPITYPIFQIGVTIGTNTGPGALGICFIKKFDRM